MAIHLMTQKLAMFGAAMVIVGQGTSYIPSIMDNGGTCLNNLLIFQRFKTVLFLKYQYCDLFVVHLVISRFILFHVSIVEVLLFMCISLKHWSSLLDRHATTPEVVVFALFAFPLKCFESVHSSPCITHIWN